MSTAPASPRTRPGNVRLPVLGTYVARRGLIIGAVLVLAALALAVVALGLGDYPLSPAEVISALGGNDGFASTVVRQWRLPRVLAAVVFGAALAAAGAVFQSLTRNPLGSPDVIGFSTGAYTGVLLVSLVLPGASAAHYVSTAAGAFVGGLATAVVVYVLAYRHGLQPFRLIIVGIAVTAMLHALNVFLLLRAQAEVAMAASLWGAGTLATLPWSALGPALIALAVLAPLLSVASPSLRQLELGDDAASAHGVGVERSRGLLIVVAVALVAVVTSAAGPIAFVALAAPQIAHRLLGGAGLSVIGSAATGALLLLGADTVAQHAFAKPVPVGIVTVVGGGLYLLGLLIAQARRR